MADMRVAVDKSGRDVPARGIDNLGFLAARMPRARTNVADASGNYGDFHVLENLTRIDIDQFAAGYHKIRFDFAQSAANQSLGFVLGKNHADSFSTNKNFCPSCTDENTFD